MTIPLVTVTISIDGSGEVVTSDVQTHDRSWNDVFRGLTLVRGEIDRIFAAKSQCPFFPQNLDAAEKPIKRGAK